MKGLFRYWGYGLLLIVVGGWITKDVGPLAILVASLANLTISNRKE